MRVIIVTLLVAASAALAYFAPSQPTTADSRTPVHPKVKCPPNCIVQHGTLGPSRIAWVK